MQCNKWTTPKINAPPFTTAGWNEDGSIQWISDPVPDAITDILLDPEYESDVDDGSDVETDDEPED